MLLLSLMVTGERRVECAKDNEEKFLGLIQWIGLEHKIFMKLVINLRFAIKDKALCELFNVTTQGYRIENMSTEKENG